MKVDDDDTIPFDFSTKLSLNVDKSISKARSIDMNSKEGYKNKETYSCIERDEVNHKHQRGHFLKHTHNTWFSSFFFFFFFVIIVLYV